ncbi:MAG: hypothetical protein ACRD2G_01545, partial [Terriglobia bacterium]
MDQAIAVEWSRFLRELETRANEGPKDNFDNMGDGATAQDARSGPNGANGAVLQRLQDVVVPPPAYGAAPAPGPVTPAIEKQDSVRPQDTADAERSVMQHYGRPAVEQSRAPWLTDSPPDAPPAAEPKLETAGEPATYSMKSQWNGTTFEERRVPTMPEKEAPVPETQLFTIQEEAVEQKASSAPLANQEEQMWKSATNMDSIATEQPAGNADTMQAAHGQEASRWFVLNGMLGGAE